MAFPDVHQVWHTFYFHFHLLSPTPLCNCATPSLQFYPCQCCLFSNLGTPPLYPGVASAQRPTHITRARVNLISSSSAMRSHHATCLLVQTFDTPSTTRSPTPACPDRIVFPLLLDIRALHGVLQRPTPALAPASSAAPTHPPSSDTTPQPRGSCSSPAQSTSNAPTRHHHTGRSPPCHHRAPSSALPLSYRRHPPPNTTHIVGAIPPAARSLCLLHSVNYDVRPRQLCLAPAPALPHRRCRLLRCPYILQPLPILTPKPVPVAHRWPRGQPMPQHLPIAHAAVVASPPAATLLSAITNPNPKPHCGPRYYAHRRPHTTHRDNPHRQEKRAPPRTLISTAFHLPRPSAILRAGSRHPSLIATAISVTPGTTRTPRPPHCPAPARAPGTRCKSAPFPALSTPTAICACSSGELRRVADRSRKRVATDSRSCSPPNARAAHSSARRAGRPCPGGTACERVRGRAVPPYALGRLPGGFENEAPASVYSEGLADLCKGKSSAAKGAPRSVSRTRWHSLSLASLLLGFPSPRKIRRPEDDVDA
ncbi:hypothetical protein B0H17DRAFT_1200377 [Mycena rosella]|uniref:Uncharacterized protein n=1 Tax=Mycena rosella TaxID=1033263 RepID=A0AAD7DJ22_MYCRO|nr:hypothetical protein B0H17DRAFT_1200377 [Mycena rosella]